MIHRFVFPCLAMLLATALSEFAFADNPAETKELEAAYQSYVDAFNKHDAKAVGASWAPDSTYLVSGAANRRVVGRDEITAAFQKFFEKSPEVKLALQLQSVRLIKPDVCLTEGEAVVVENKVAVHSTFNDVWIKTDGKWLINTAQETVSPSEGKNENLRELDWAVGSWIEKGEGVEVKTTCRWTLDGAFLIRNFSAVMDGQSVFRGNQIIGWDPAKKCIRSWTFDSDGGFSEGAWTRDNERRWSIASAGVMADGRRVTSKQILEHPDNDTVLFRQVSREAEGQLLPSIPAVKAERQQAE